MYRAFAATLTALLVVGAARASPYWIEYEPANGHFPEEEGWTRIWNDGGALRTLEDGCLVIDSRASYEIVDYYRQYLDGHLNPGPAETFLMEWRMTIDEVDGRHDPGVSVFGDDKWAVGFAFSLDTIESGFEYGVSASFDPGVPHSFEFSSSDMRAYALYIDGQLAIQGSFWESLDASHVGWGDVVEGSSSLTRWDYFEFGVVPEPSARLSVTSIGSTLVLFRLRRRSTSTSCHKETYRCSRQR
jgi:hypothetical protein